MNFVKGILKLEEMHDVLNQCWMFTSAQNCKFLNYINKSKQDKLFISKNNFKDLRKNASRSQPIESKLI